MKQFFKFMFASAFGFIIAGGLLVLIFFISIAGLVSSLEDGIKSEKKVSVKENTVLHLKLNQPIVDRAEENPFAKLDFGPFKNAGQIGLNELLESIEKAKEDDRVKGIYLDLKSYPGGMASMVELRNALKDFKESGKWIMAYSSNYSQGGYYLASIANSVYLYPEGELSWKGLNAEITFFKNTLDKLGVEPQIIRGKNNKFKSAVEPFMKAEMSEANRLQTKKYLTSIWGKMLGDISAERGLSIDQLNLLADSLMITSADDAVKHKVIDGTRYYDEFTAELRDSLNIEKDDDLEFISYNKYKKTSLKKIDDDDKPSYKIKNKVAVIYAQGSIETGKSDGTQTMGSETIANAIREARKDSNVKAIVLRVNSPGGSALASDIMWRETELAKEEKPFIVSMGDLAASGGYYISAYGDRIFAQPTTITGSIGVFGIIPNAKKFFNDKLGITFDGVKTNAHSDLMTISKPLDDFEYSKIQDGVEDVYSTFLNRVAKGRGMTVEEVDKIGQGRVWTGADAKEIGLVDELGGLEDAINYAAAQAELEEGDYKVREYPKQEDPFEKFLRDMQFQAKYMYADMILGSDYNYLMELEKARNMDGIQARMPYVMRIK